MSNEAKNLINEARALKIVDQAYKYMKMVLREDYPGWEIKAQCKKLEKLWDEDQFKEDCKYFFSLKEIKKICGLLKLLNFATGFVANKPVYENLSDYQCFLIVNLFGWRHKDKPHKFKHRYIILFVARKNAKVLVP